MKASLRAFWKFLIPKGLKKIAGGLATATPPEKRSKGMHPEAGARTVAMQPQPLTPLHLQGAVNDNTVFRGYRYRSTTRLLSVIPLGSGGAPLKNPMLEHPGPGEAKTLASTRSKS